MQIDGKFVVKGKIQAGLGSCIATRNFGFMYSRSRKN